MNPVDPPDLPLWQTIRHLYPLWRAQWRLVSLGLACALAFTGLTLTIPVLVQRTIDDAIDGTDQSLLVPYLARDRRGGSAPVRHQLHPPVRDRPRRDRGRGAAALAALRRVPPLSARLLRPARDRRGDLARDERHLPRPLLHRLGRRPGDAEHDDARRRGDRAHARQPACSRSTAALAMPPIAVLTYLFARRVFPISRQVQRRKGHLTEASDEAVVGIEMVQAFGREDDVRDRFHGARRGGARTRPCARRRRGALPARADLPADARHRRGAALRRPPGDRRQPDDRPVHAVRDAAAAARLAARGARLDHEPRPARDRRGLAQLRVARGDRAARRARRRRAAARRPAPRAVRGRPLPLRGGERGALRASTSRPHRARSSPSAGRPGRARRRSSTSCRASTTRRRDACSSEASTPATFRSRSCAARSRSSRRGPCSSRCRCATTCSRAGPTPTGARCSTRARPRASPRSWPSSPTATTR